MRGRATLLAIVVALSPLGAHAQGCSQCRETVGLTPPRTQTAYRRGIAVLTLAAGGLFTAALLVGRGFRTEAGPTDRGKLKNE